jgi:hypothetical protein
MTDLLFKKLSEMGEYSTVPKSEDKLWFWVVDPTEADPANRNKFADFYKIITDIETYQLKDGCITSEKIAGGAITNPKLAEDSVDSSNIKAGAINTTHLATNFLLPFTKMDGLNTDPNADRLVFFDDSAGKLQYLTVGYGLNLSGTNLSVTLPAATDWAVDQQGLIYIHGNNLPLDASTWLTAGSGITISGRVISAGLSGDLIADNAVTDAKLRDSSAYSVIGRSSNTAGDPADIIASSDGYVLRRSGTTLGFGTLGSASLADGAVTAGKIAAGGVSATNQIADGIITPEKLINQPTIINVRVFDENTLVSGGTGKAQIFVPYDVDGAVLSKVDIGVVTPSTSGAISVQIYRLDTSTNLLSTAASLAANNYNTAASGTRGAGSTTVTKGQRLRIDVTYAGSTAKGLDVQLVFVK